MFKIDNSIKNEKAEMVEKEDKFGDLVEKFDYKQCLEDIYYDVFYNSSSIIRNNCAEFESYGVTEKDLNRNLTSFLHEDFEGIILIGDKTYSVDKVVFRIIDIATHEKILEYVNALFKNCNENFFANKKAFYEKLKNAKSNYGFKPTLIRYASFDINYDYKTKKNYILSLIGTSILEEYMTTAKGSTLYKELKKSENVLI